MRSNAVEGMDEDLDLEDDDGIFNEAEYDFYMQPENINFCARKPIGYSVINHYMCAILDLHQQQFIQFCEAKYSSESPAQSASTVTEEKLFGFLHYQSCRPLCP